MTDQPTMESIPSGYRCNFPDETSLEAIDVEQDRSGRLFVTLAAFHGERLLHRARFNLLDQGAQRDFHRGASILNGHIQLAGSDDVVDGWDLASCAAARPILRGYRRRV